MAPSDTPDRNQRSDIKKTTMTGIGRDHGSGEERTPRDRVHANEVSQTDGQRVVRAGLIMVSATGNSSHEALKMNIDTTAIAGSAKGTMSRVSTPQGSRAIKSE
jgi:hypothetical protein